MEMISISTCNSSLLFKDMEELYSISPVQEDKASSQLTSMSKRLICILPGAEQNLASTSNAMNPAAAVNNLSDVLPKIHTPRLGQGLRESMTGASLGGIAPTTPGSQCEDVEMEAVVLSEVWKVFEQLMKQVSGPFSAEQGDCASEKKS